MSYRIDPIHTEDMLDQAVAFRLSVPNVSGGDSAARLKSDIGSLENCDLPVGIVGRSNDEIVGVMFFCYQGRDNNGQGSSIVSISDFAVEEEHRGMLPFMMMKNAVKLLDGAVITNFTPSADMRKIWSILKFQFQPVSWHCIFPLQLGWLFSRHKVKRVERSSTPKRVDGIDFLSRTAPNMEIFEIKDKAGKVLTSWGMNRTLTRKIVGIPVPVRCHWVWAIDGEGEMQQAAASLSRHLFFRRGIFVTVFASSNMEKWPLTYRFPTTWMVRGVGGTSAKQIYPPFSSEAFL